jgi:hypothetical protein
MMTRTAVAAASCILRGALPASHRAPEGTLDDLAFLAGAWEAEDGAESMREVWDAPRGDAMVGHFSIVRDGHAVLYEILAIEDAADAPPALRLRHFGAGLTPWASEAAGPLTFPLAEVGEGKAVFTDPDRDFPRRCIYTLEGDKLTVRLEPAPDSEREEIAITFTRADH